MLRRLEDQSLLVSERRSEGSRLKRMYQLSKAGVAAHAAMSEQWRSLTNSLCKLNGDNE
jgi:DNA-binding PadR family transcriptional regulator